MQLAYLPIYVNSETVYNGSYTGIRSTDYNMNYTDGKIQPLSTGNFNFNATLGSTVYSIDYGHNCTSGLSNMTGSAQTLANLVPLFLVLTLVMVFIRPLL